jgi:hypothetical protein
MNGPNKGPQGKDEEGRMDWPMPETQERYEEEGDRDVIVGERSLEPFDHRAPEDDHTPNGKTVLKDGKIGWNFQRGRGNGGLGL